MRQKTKAQIQQIRDPHLGEVWIWKCRHNRCRQWTHTPNISVAPRGIGFARKWEGAISGLMHHLLDEHPSRPRRAQLRACLTLAVLAALVVGWVALVLSLDEPASPAPAPSPSPSSTWSDECTAEDLDDGACLTYDDIRNQPTYTQSTTPTP